MMQNIVDILFFLGSMINAGLFIPQAYKIYNNKSAKELSAFTFIGFNLIQIVTMLHGYYHNDVLLILGNIANFITCALVTGLIIFYKLKDSYKPLKLHKEFQHGR